MDLFIFFIQVFIILIMILFIILILKFYIFYSTDTSYEKNIISNNPYPIPDKFIFNEVNTFVINMKKNTTRWTNMINRLNHFNITPTRWEASTASTMIDRFIYTRYKVRDVRDGEKGCAQSHMNIWKHIVKNNIPYALICEDDACFDKQWLEKLHQLPKDDYWDCIFLNASNPTSTPFEWCVSENQYFSAGYILSYKGAIFLTEKFNKAITIADDMTQYIQLQKHSYVYFPYLIVQEGKDTLIGNPVKENYDKLINELNNINYSIDNYIF